MTILKDCAASSILRYQWYMYIFIILSLLMITIAKIIIDNDRFYHSKKAMAHVGLAVRPADRIIVVRAGFGAFCGKAVLIKRMLSKSNNVVVRAGFGAFCREKSKAIDKLVNNGNLKVKEREKVLRGD